MGGVFRSLLPVATAAVLWAVSAAANAAPVAYDLAVQPLEPALKAAAAAGGLNLVANGDLLAGKTAPALKGSFEPAEALARLLAGSGLAVAVTDGNAVVTQMSGDIALPPVKVAAPLLGPNGSTDVTATEGTGSYASPYASVGSKIPLPTKDTPQSVSVLTQQRIQDQNLFDMASAVEQMPGIDVIPFGSATIPLIISRGFAISNIQFDGGAPFNGYNNYKNNPLSFDMAEYDHIELLRGADGLFAGAGDPSGSINLARKRPLDHFQVLGEFDGGSWDNFREMADVTGPLVDNGKLRGRFVVENQDQDYFYKIANSHHKMVYGIIEADLTPSTLLTIGGSYADYHTKQNPAGLPRWDNGDMIPYARSTCLCYPWEHDNFDNDEAFLKLDQKINDQWTANLNFTTTGQTENRLEAYPLNVGDQGLPIGTSYNFSSRQYLWDGTLHGKFDVFGQPQQFIIGGNYQWFDLTALQPNMTWSSVSTVSLFPFDANGDPAPQQQPGNRWGNGYHQGQYGLYSMARLQPIDFLHLFGGFRLSGYQTSSYFGDPSSSLPERSLTRENGIITPYGGASVDLTKQLAAYVSYTSIFQSQANNLQAPLPGTPLPPVEGNTYEAGLKSDLNNGKLKATAAFFRTDQVNSAVTDPAYPNGVSIGQFSTCCFLPAGKNLSEGVELELNGEITTGWQVSGSLTYDYQAVKYGDTLGQPVNPEYPKYLWKLWTTYRLPGNLQDFSIGGGVNGQTSYYQSGTVGTVFNRGTGDYECPCVPYRFNQPSWTTVSLRGAWQVTPNVLAAVNVTNVFDEKYLVLTNAPTSFNFYGEPRSVMFSLRFKY